MDRARPLNEAPPWAGVAAGLLAGLAAVAVGAVVAGAIHRPSPMDAVGTAVIDRTPADVKHWAIQTFGRHDKDALRAGTAVLLLVAAAAIGAAAVRRWVVAPIGVAAFTALGVAAAVTRAGSSASAAWGPLVGGAAALAVFALLLPLRTDEVAAAPAPGSEDRPVLSWPRRSVAGGRWDRRVFLGRSAATVGLVVVAAAVARAETHEATTEAIASAPPRLPDPVGPRVVVPAGATVDGATPYVTPAGDFYRIDTALSYPRIRADRWKLHIGGMVDHPLTLTYDDLRRRPQVERAVTLTCVSNEVGGDLIGNAVWQGVLLRDLLAEAGPSSGAEQLASRSVDGFTAGFPLDVATDPARDCLVAIGMNGRPLPLEHGFPARLVVPGLYGYVSATKWLEQIDLTTWDGFDGYWIGQGWAKRGPIKTGSRIDVPRSGSEVTAGRIAVAGVAWAQHRGISKVEVQVDDGPWHEARLAEVVSDDTWRQWVWTWNASPGTHRLRVRATDGTGRLQTGDEAPPPPDGATGWHERKVKVRRAG